MGIISNLQLEFDTYPRNRIMKLCLLAIALVAGVIAEPESKPWIYGGYYGLGGYGLGYGLGYGGYGGYHYLGKRSADAEPESNAESDPLVVGYYPLGNGYALGGYYGLGGIHYIGKRPADAEAEPESKPWIYGYGGYGLGGYYGGYLGRYHYLGKRSADAEPESKPWYGYRGYGLGGYGLGYGRYYGWGK